MSNRRNPISSSPGALYRPGKTAPYRTRSYASSMADPSGDTAINLKQIWEIIYRGKWIILGVCLLITGGAAVYTLRIPPTYEGTSIVAVDSRGTYMPGIQAPIEGRMVTTEVGVLGRSSELANRVASNILKAADSSGDKTLYPIVLSQPGSDVTLPVEDIATKLSRRVKFLPVSSESMIYIVAESTSPQEAAQIANEYATEYKEYAQEVSRASIVAARTFLEEQVRQVQQELSAIENQYESFANSRQVVTQGEAGERVVAEYINLVTQRDDRQFQLKNAENEKRLLEAELARVRPDLEGRVATGLQMEIDELQRRVVDLKLQAETYYKVDPSLRGNEDRVAELKRIVDEINHWENRKNQLVQQLAEQTLSSGVSKPGGELDLAASLTSRINEIDLNINRLQYEIDLLEDRIASYGGRLGTIPRQTIENEQLQRRRELVESWFKMYQTELQKYLVAEQSDLGYVSLVRMASIPVAPVRPDVQKNILLALMVGLFFGTGLVFITRAVRNRLEKPEDVQALGYDLLGIIPPMEREIKTSFQGRKEIEVGGRKLSTNLLPLLQPWSTSSENYRLVRTNLQRGKAGEAPQLVLVTSPEMSDGKTVNAVNIAITMAQSGSRTLLIDADLRRPNAHRLLGRDKGPGLAEILEMSEDELPAFEHYRTDIRHLTFIPAGSSNTPPPELVGSSTMEELLIKAREAFDVIVIDSPPVLAATDALLLATRADSTIVVVSAQRTEPRALLAVRTMLEGVGVEAIWTLLNRFDSTKAGYDRYGLGYGYSYKYEYRAP